MRLLAVKGCFYYVIMDYPSHSFEWETAWPISFLLAITIVWPISYKLLEGGFWQENTHPMCLCMHGFDFHGDKMILNLVMRSEQFAQTLPVYDHNMLCVYVPCQKKTCYPDSTISFNSFFLPKSSDVFAIMPQSFFDK